MAESKKGSCAGTKSGTGSWREELKKAHALLDQPGPDTGVRRAFLSG